MDGWNGFGLLQFFFHKTKESLDPKTVASDVTKGLKTAIEGIQTMV